MKNKNIKTLGQDKVDIFNDKLAGKSAVDVLVWLYENFSSNRVALASSLGVEDQVLTHMVLGVEKSARIFTLDTGRLPQETYDLLEGTMKRYGCDYEVSFPDTKDVESMIKAYGPNLFYESIKNRKLCCKIRKVDPLKKILATLDVWICGLRRDQSITRANDSVIEWDESNQLIKVNPLINWSLDETWDYVKTHTINTNVLHEQGYPSLGCAPCTRAIQDGEDVRAGRWWWESPGNKECGLHFKDGKLVRSKG
jgi:phosphoadenosine phosphosulfate reductase